MLESFLVLTPLEQKQPEIALGFCRVRIEPYGGAKVLKGRCCVTRLLQCPRKVSVRGSEAGVQFKCLTQAADGFIGFTLGQERRSQVG